jgi:hypothetical protein
VAATFSAKVPFVGAQEYHAIPFQLGLEDFDELSTFDFEGCGIPTEIDREPSASTRLATDAAVAALIRAGFSAFERKSDFLASARAFELHLIPPHPQPFEGLLILTPRAQNG